MRPRRRKYILTFYAGDGGDVGPVPACVTSSYRIGVVCSHMFRAVFGRAPVKRLFWHVDGFMAGADDERGNAVIVEQVNHDQEPGFYTGTGTFPLRVAGDVVEVSSTARKLGIDERAVRGWAIDLKSTPLSIAERLRLAHFLSQIQKAPGAGTPGA